MGQRQQFDRIDKRFNAIEEILQRLYGSQIALARIIDVLRKKGLVTDAEITDAIKEAATKRNEKVDAGPSEHPVVDESNVGHGGLEQDVYTNESDGIVKFGDAENKS